MGRPKIIKIESGEVVLKNLSKEKADEITALLKGEETQQPVVESEAPQSDLPYETYGVCGIPGERNWKTVTIKYNDLTKEAYVVDVYSTDTKAIAVNEFMKKCHLKGIV